MPDLRLPRLMRLVRLIVPRRLSRAALVVGIALGSTLLAAHAGVGRAAAPLPAPSTSRAGAVASTAPVPLVAAWLGVHMAAASAGVRGVGVTHVVRGSPASKAGVIDGDRIVKVDGVAVSQPGDVSAAVAKLGSGKSLTLDLARGTTSLSLVVALTARPRVEEIFRLANVGQVLPPLPSLAIASGPGPAQYPGLTGHVVLVDLFATWCGPCAQLGPHYASFHTKYSGKGLVVLGVSREDTSLLSGWSTQNAVPYTVTSDPTDTVFERLEAPALPSSLLIDKHGVVRDVWVGYESGQVVATEQRIQALLAEP